MAESSSKRTSFSLPVLHPKEKPIDLVITSFERLVGRSLGWYCFLFRSFPVRTCFACRARLLVPEDCLFL